MFKSNLGKQDICSKYSSKILEIYIYRSQETAAHYEIEILSYLGQVLFKVLMKKIMIFITYADDRRKYKYVVEEDMNST